MQQAMKNLGFEKEDLDPKKTLEDFMYSSKIAGQPMSPSEYDENVVDLRFRHYQQRLMDRINKVIQERKSIKNRGLAKDGNSRNLGKAQSHTALPTIKHVKRDASGGPNKSELFRDGTFDAYNSKSRVAITIKSSRGLSMKDDFMSQALNRVKESQKKQMKVIQASL